MELYDVLGRHGIFDSICREQHDMPFQLSTSVNLESGFINIEKVTQKHIKMLLGEEKLNSLGAHDYKCRLKHELVHGFLSSNEWKNTFLIPKALPVDNKTKSLQYKTRQLQSPVTVRNRPR